MSTPPKVGDRIVIEYRPGGRHEPVFLAAQEYAQCRGGSRAAAIAAMLQGSRLYHRMVQAASKRRVQKLETPENADSSPLGDLGV